MSTRCKACNSQISFYDYYSLKSDTLPELEDLCSTCRGVAYSAEFINTHEHQHEHLTENWESFTVYNESS